MKSFLIMIYDGVMWCCDNTGGIVFSIPYLFKVSHINVNHWACRGWNVMHRNDTENYAKMRNGTIYGYVFGTREWSYGFMKVYGNYESDYKWGYDCWHRDSGHPKRVYKKLMKDHKRDGK